MRVGLVNPAQLLKQSDEVVPMLASHLGALNAEIRSLALQSHPSLRRMPSSSPVSRSSSNSADLDIEALAFIVMMAAASSAQQDLEPIMNGIKTITAEKSLERQLIDQINRMRARVSRLRLKKPW
jgi:hypothetical protein